MLEGEIFSEREDPDHDWVIFIFLGEDDIVFGIFKDGEFMFESHASAHFFLKLGIAAKFAILKQFLLISG